MPIQRQPLVRRRQHRLEILEVATQEEDLELPLHLEAVLLDLELPRRPLRLEDLLEVGGLVEVVSEHRQIRAHSGHLHRVADCLEHQHQLLPVEYSVVPMPEELDLELPVEAPLVDLEPPILTLEVGCLEHQLHQYSVHQPLVFLVHLLLVHLGPQLQVRLEPIIRVYLAHRLLGLLEHPQAVDLVRRLLLHSGLQLQLRSELLILVYLVHPLLGLSEPLQPVRLEHLQLGVVCLELQLPHPPLEALDRHHLLLRVECLGLQHQHLVEVSLDRHLRGETFLEEHLHHLGEVYLERLSNNKELGVVPLWLHTKRPPVKMGRA